MSVLITLFETNILGYTLFCFFVRGFFAVCITHLHLAVNIKKTPVYCTHKLRGKQK